MSKPTDRVPSRTITASESRTTLTPVPQPDEFLRRARIATARVTQGTTRGES